MINDVIDERVFLPGKIRSRFKNAIVIADRPAVKQAVIKRKYDFGLRAIWFLAKSVILCGLLFVLGYFFMWAYVGSVIINEVLL